MATLRSESWLFLFNLIFFGIADRVLSHTKFKLNKQKYYFFPLRFNGCSKV